jgi:hypothetical protein
VKSRAVLIDGQGKKVDYKDGKGPSDREIEKQQWKAEQGIGFIEDVQEGEIKHNDAHDEKNNP